MRTQKSDGPRGVVDAKDLPEVYADIAAAFPNAEYEYDAQGTLRFKSNELNRWLVDNGVDLNKMSIACQQGAFSVDARMKFYQDLGYSLRGFLECFSDEVYRLADLANGVSPADAHETPPDAETVHDLLGLVMEDPPAVEDIATWHASMTREAVAWAGAVHLSASDNDDVVVPERPVFL